MPPIAAWPNILTPFHRNAPIAGDLTALAARHRWPVHYLELLNFMNGGEGFIGNNYVRLFTYQDAVSINHDSPLREIRDELFIFGSTGGGEAFAFDERAQSRVIQVPFIPLTRTHANVIADNLRIWLSSAQAARPTNPALLGKEIYEVKPIVFGGDPVDPQNKTTLDLQEYIQAAVWWNNLYRQMKA